MSQFYTKMHLVTLGVELLALF